jgi:hypothetical protein
MADKKEPPEEGGTEDNRLDSAPDETRRFGDSRRRLPLAALAVLLALIGIGVYVAWPDIQDSLRPSPSPAVAEAESVPVAEPPAVAEPEPEIEPIPAVEAEPAPAIEESPATPPEPSPALLALAEQVAALQRALAERDAAPPPAPPPAPDLTPIHDAMARLEELEKRLNEVPPPQAASDEATPASDEASAVAAPAMDLQARQRLNAVERTLALAELDRRGGEFDALRAAQAKLRDRVAALSQSLAAVGGREAEGERVMVLVLALSRLSRATATAAPFGREMEAFSAAAQAGGATGLAFDNAMRELAAHALAGAPTLARLTAAYDDVALAVIQADADAEDQGWVDATIGRLRRIVTLRRVGGDIAADSLEGRLSALHRALAGGDLGAAIVLAEALPAKARSGAEDWLRGARARLAVERALAVLDGEISARVAARWAPRESPDK